MSHIVFQQLYANQEIAVNVSIKDARLLVLMGPLSPKKIQYYLYAFSGYSLLALAIALGIWVKWWWALIIAPIAVFFFALRNELATRSVVDLVLLNEAHYEHASTIGIIKVVSPGQREKGWNHHRAM